jgi:hypothetical protein
MFPTRSYPNKFDNVKPLRTHQKPTGVHQPTSGTLVLGLDRLLRLWGTRSAATLADPGSSQKAFARSMVLPLRCWPWVFGYHVEAVVHFPGLACASRVKLAVPRFQSARPRLCTCKLDRDVPGRDRSG